MAADIQAVQVLVEEPAAFGDRTGWARYAAAAWRRSNSVADFEPPCSSRYWLSSMVDFDAIRLDAQIRAFASALRAVHKSKSWDYVGPLAAQGWVTLGSTQTWESVEARVEAHWLDLAPGN